MHKGSQGVCTILSISAHNCTTWKAVSRTRSHTLSAHFEAFACGFSTSISSSCFSYNSFTFSLPMDSINCASDNTQPNHTYMHHTHAHTEQHVADWLTDTSCKRHPTSPSPQQWAGPIGPGGESAPWRCARPYYGGPQNN